LSAGLEVALRRRLAGRELDVRFGVEPGITVLFGDSGAGKTLTLRMIAGLLDPDAGRVVLAGRVLCDTVARVRVRPQERHLGFVFQQDALLPHLTVRENVRFGGRGLAPAERRERCEGLLGQLRLADLADRRPEHVSGGQRQRASLARALMQRPAALLLDEPFSALDLATRRYTRDCLVQVMREQHVPVILVTHDLVEALTVADRMLVLVDGRIVQEGPPAEVVAHPADERVAALTDLGALRPP
jgi:molybdate transport system ATP-binding protein